MSGFKVRSAPISRRFLSATPVVGAPALTNRPYHALFRPILTLPQRALAWLRATLGSRII
jgi:hypothetical protein